MCNKIVSRRSLRDCVGDEIPLVSIVQSFIVRFRVRWLFISPSSCHIGFVCSFSGRSIGYINQSIGERKCLRIFLVVLLLKCV